MLWPHTERSNCFWTFHASDIRRLLAPLLIHEATRAALKNEKIRQETTSAVTVLGEVKIPR